MQQADILNASVLWSPVDPRLREIPIEEIAVESYPNGSDRFRVVVRPTEWGVYSQDDIGSHEEARQYALMLAARFSPPVADYTGRAGRP